MINFLLLPSFKRKIKQYSKKFKSIKNDLISLQEQLLQNPTNAITIQDNIYKIRLLNTSINKGKSSGYRVYYYYKNNDNEIILMYIYSKNEQANLNDTKLDNLVIELESFLKDR